MSPSRRLTGSSSSTEGCIEALKGIRRARPALCMSPTTEQRLQGGLLVKITAVRLYPDKNKAISNVPQV